jgi:deltex-like protein
MSSDDDCKSAAKGAAVEPCTISMLTSSDGDSGSDGALQSDKVCKQPARSAARKRRADSNKWNEADQVDADRKYAEKLQREEDRAAKRACPLKEAEAMATSIAGRAVLSVQEIIALVNNVKQTWISKNPTLGRFNLDTVGVDDMVDFCQGLLDRQQKFREKNINAHIDVGYHYTDQRNMDSIRRHGLLTAADRTSNSVRATGKGAAFGDGIYTANNSTAFSSYGSVGLVVGRLQGKAVRVARTLEGHLSCDIEGINTIIGDKLDWSRVTTTLDSEGWPVRDTYHEHVLKSSKQCLPVIWYDRAIEMNDVGRECLRCIKESLQVILDKLFNGGAEKVEVRDVPLIKPLAASHVLRYFAPQSLCTDVFTGEFLGPPSSSSVSESCSICWDQLGDKTKCKALKACKHIFHTECIKRAFESKPECPVCRKSIGEPQGKSPSGTMSIILISNRCSGYDTASISIRYNILPGRQLGYHENPGKYHTGKYTTAYLPDNADGRNLCKRLKFAFMHGLTFTVGTSLTTGATNQCTVSVDILSAFYTMLSHKLQ